MKKTVLFALLLFIGLNVYGQIPNFGTTVGDRKLYGCSILKYRANANVWETYSLVQYGITDYLQAGAEIYTAGSNVYIGYGVRGGYKFSQYFKLGGQVTPSFDLQNNHKFSYLTSSVYMNGDITKDGRLFWVTNTSLENSRTELTSAIQKTFFGYTFALGNSGINSISPMAGLIHSWKFDQDPDLSFGFFYTHKDINMYVWTNDILTKTPRFIVAIEYMFSVN